VRAQAAPRGIAFPVVIGVDGRIGVSEGQEQSRSLLRRALSDCSNDNGFRQGLGIAPRAVFRVAGDVTSAVLKSDAERVFAGLTDRFLMLETRVLPPEPGGRLVAAVTYQDRVSGDIDRLDIPIRSA